MEKFPVLLSACAMILAGLAILSPVQSSHLPPGADDVSAVVDGRCETHSCARVQIDTPANANNVLDASPGADVADPLYWGSQRVLVSGDPGIDADTLDGMDSTAFLRSPSGGLRVIAGRVYADGSVATGTGFSSIRTDLGTYTITFSPPFRSL